VTGDIRSKRSISQGRGLLAHRIDGILWLLSMASLLVQLGAAPATALEARVESSLEPAGTVWVGERVTLRVDLKTDGLSFRSQRVRLPKIPGALLLEDAATTVKLTEEIDGEPWQVLRYEYPLFLQRVGRTQIESVRVAFEATAGFGTEPRAFDLSTAPVSLTARAPEGVEDVTRLVTTTDFEVRVELDPEPGEEVVVGDALTRRIERRAVDLTGMAFAPLVTAQIPGIASYDKAPRIEERRHRGEMIGTRTDSTTFVFQEPGSYVIPGFELAWWNPQTRQLSKETIPDLEIEVAENPLLRSGGDEVEAAVSRLQRRPGLLAVLGLLAFAIGWGGWRWGPGLARRLRTAWAVRSDSEPARLRALVRACRSNRPALAYNAFVAWQKAHGTLARGAGDGGELAVEVERMQRALVGEESAWTGRALVRALRRTRRANRAHAGSPQSSSLRALNPERPELRGLS
jgi:hypothetical protein